MNKFFKVSLVAAAVALSGGAIAGDLALTAGKYSAEGLAVDNAGMPNNSVALPNVIEYTANTNYPEGAKVRLAFTPGSIAAGFVFPPTINTKKREYVNGADKESLQKLGVLSAPQRIDSDTVEYTVTAIALGAIAVTDAVGAGLFTDAAPTLNELDAQGVTTSIDLGDVLDLGSAFFAKVPLLGSKVAASAVSLTVTAKYASDAELDASTKNMKELTTVESQFGTAKATTGFNAKIDVAAARMKFTNSELSDTAIIGFDHVNTALVSAKNTTKLAVTVDAQLPGFKVADTTNVITGVEILNDTGTAALPGVTPVTYKDNKLSFSTTTDTDALDGFQIKITPPVTNAGAKTEAVELMVQDFAVSAEYTYGSKKGSLGTAAAGSWSFNGSSGDIEYMPYGDTITQIIYVTNTGTVEGDITVDAVVNGEKISLGVVGKATAKSVTAIASPIKKALEAAGITGKAKAKLKVVVNSPSTDISVYASYNVGGADRGFVPVANN